MNVISLLIGKKLLARMHDNGLTKIYAKDTEEGDLTDFTNLLFKLETLNDEIANKEGELREANKHDKVITASTDLVLVLIALAAVLGLCIWGFNFPDNLLEIMQVISWANLISFLSKDLIYSIRKNKIKQSIAASKKQKEDIEGCVKSLRKSMNIKEVTLQEQTMSNRDASIITAAASSISGNDVIKVASKLNMCAALARIVTEYYENARVDTVEKLHLLSKETQQYRDAVARYKEIIGILRDVRNLRVCEGIEKFNQENADNETHLVKKS